MNSSTSFLDALKEKFSLSKITLHEASGDVEVFTTVENSFEFLKELQNNSERKFEHMADLTAYDESPKNPRFHVIYELISMKEKHRLRVVVPVDDKKPSIKSVVSLWAGASWLEREVFDLYGIEFTEHGDLRRILLPPSFQGHPLRKDFVFDYRQEFSEESKDEAVFNPFGNTWVENKESKK